MTGKPKAAKLSQSSFEDPDIFTLTPSETAMITGTMGGCCSVILLWGRAHGGGGYVNVRGQHGAGGPGAINWDRLIPPPLLPTIRDANNIVVMACASQDFNRSDFNGYAWQVRQELIRRRIICTYRFVPYSNAVVTRDGQVAEHCNLKDQHYQIRETPGAAFGDRRRA